MTHSECDSTSDILFKDAGSIHAHGCTGTSAPCTSSILRLALIAGSTYALRFTTCIVNVNSSRRPKERARYSPYQKKRTIGTSVSTVYQPSDEEAVDVVSSSTDFVLPGEDTRDQLPSEIIADSPSETNESTGVPEQYDSRHRSAGKSDKSTYPGRVNTVH